MNVNVIELCTCAKFTIAELLDRIGTERALHDDESELLEAVIKSLPRQRRNYTPEEDTAILEAPNPLARRAVACYLGINIGALYNHRDRLLGKRDISRLADANAEKV